MKRPWRDSFHPEITTTLGHDENGVPVKVSADEVIRPETSVEGLSKLRPVFDPRNGTITAGNSSAISDGASSLLLTSESFAKEMRIPL